MESTRLRLLALQPNRDTDFPNKFWFLSKEQDNNVYYYRMDHQRDMLVKLVRVGEWWEVRYQLHWPKTKISAKFRYPDEGMQFIEMVLAESINFEPNITLLCNHVHTTENGDEYKTQVSTKGGREFVKISKRNELRCFDYAAAADLPLDLLVKLANIACRGS